MQVHWKATAILVLFVPKYFEHLVHLAYKVVHTVQFNKFVVLFRYYLYV